MPVETHDSHLISVRIPLELYEQLIEVKNIEGCSLTALVCRCLRETLRSRSIYIAHKHHLERVRARKEAKGK